MGTLAGNVLTLFTRIPHDRSLKASNVVPIPVVVCTYSQKLINAKLSFSLYLEKRMNIVNFFFDEYVALRDICWGN